MSIAVTKGKISRSGSNLTSGSEDLLTASVFGPMRYLPSEKLLLPVLRRARNLQGQFYEPPKVHRNSGLKIEFWPGFKRCEPDVMIEFGDQELMFIEAKFRSGKSGAFNADQVPVDVSNVLDQLAREWLDLVEVNHYKSQSLIYLTAHRTLPEGDIKDSAKELLKHRVTDPDLFKESTYWLSWFDVWDEARSKIDDKDDSYIQIVMKDIVEFLEKLELKHFTGFSIGENIAIEHPESLIFYNYE